MWVHAALLVSYLLAVPCSNNNSNRHNYYILILIAGEGCSFITADCDTWQYSCSPQDVDGCSYDYQAAVST